MEATQKPAGFTFSDAVYLRLKFIALVFLPAVTTLYFTLGSVWDLPHVEKVIGTLSAVDAFLGVLLNLSTKAYNASYDGNMVIHKEDGKTIYSLEYEGNLDEIEDRQELKFKVGKPPFDIS